MSERGDFVHTHNAPGDPWRSSPALRLCLPACLTVYLALATTLALVFPLGQAPDEIAHVQYALFIAENGRLPDFHADDAGYEAYQAPLYYTLCAAIGKLAMIGAESGHPQPPAVLSESDAQISSRLPRYPTVRSGQHDLAVDALRSSYRLTVAQRRAWMAMRLFTVLLGGLGIFLGYRIALLVFPGRQWLACGVAAIMAAQPMYAHICGAVGNDPPATVAVGFVLLMSLLILREGPTPTRSGLLGLALGIAMLSKDSANAALPAAMLALLLSVGRRHDPKPADTYLTDAARRVAALDWGLAFRRLALVLGVATVVAGWWYARNILVYGGVTHFPANVEKQIPWEAYVGHPEMIAQVLSIALPMAFRNFWAGFAWTNIAVEPWLHWLLLVVSAAALPGLLMLVADARAGRLGWSLLQVRSVWLLILTKVLLGLAVLWYILTIDLGGGSQGRYLFPVLSVMALLWLLGVARLLPERTRPALPIAAGVGMLAFALWCLFGAIIPFYRALGLV